MDIVQYRCRIGQFCPKNRRRKYLYRNYSSKSSSEKTGKSVLSSIQYFLKIITVLVLTSQAWLPFIVPSPSCHGSLLCVQSQVSSSAIKCHERSVVQASPCTRLGTGNFWARYINGNDVRVKGIKNIHFNIRSLRYKVGEIKNLVNQEHPNILGLSEVELKKENVDIASLKVPGYDILFPKSWHVHGFARVVIYVKKTFSYEQLHDLEDDIIQSVWLRGAFKNSKKIYFCHAYREHSSVMGDSIPSQKMYLSNFLSQWEAAVSHNFSIEPNEVHVCLDMNLDYLKEKWLQPTYRLCSLTRLVQNVCNANDFSQLVSQPTRTMHNSVTGTTEMSCIDHVYCNTRHKCSTPSVKASGASDHDIVSYIRYSKAPPEPSRTIRRRSYKNFIKEDFLTDLAAVNWSEVYRVRDVDDAVEVFTNKFKYILNQHAPWII